MSVEGGLGGGKGGGSAATTQAYATMYDPATQKVLRENMKQQQAMAQETWDLWKEFALPYEKDMYAANRELLPAQTEVAQKTLEEQSRDLELGRANKDALREQQLREIEQSAPVSKAFYKQTMEGVDPNEEAYKAEVDVRSAANKEREALTSDLASYGIDPSSGKYSNLKLQLGMDTAKNVAGARSTARQRARDENFSRLYSGMAARGGVTGLPGVYSTTGSTDSFGNYSLTNLGNQSANYYGGSTSAAGQNMVALSGYGAGGQRSREWNVGGKIKASTSPVAKTDEG